MKTFEVCFMNGDGNAVVMAEYFSIEGRMTFFKQFDEDVGSNGSVHMFVDVVSIVMRPRLKEIGQLDLLGSVVKRELISEPESIRHNSESILDKAEQVDEVFQQEVVEDAVNVDPISEEQKKTPAVAEWRRVVNLEAKNRRISFDQAAKLVNASSPALYGAMLMETGATMEEALRLMQDARR